MSKKDFIKLVKENYSYVEIDDEMNSSDVEILYICLLCEKIHNIKIETSSFFDMYFKYVDNEIGICSYVVFINDRMLYIEIVNGMVVNIIHDDESIIKNVNYIIKESRC